MSVRIWVRQETVFSQASVRISGQMPMESRITVRIETGISRPVSGRASRFVRRK